MKWMTVSATVIAALGFCILFLILTSTEGNAGERKIVFSGEDAANLEIFIIDINGRNLKNLTNHPAIDKDPAPSPNGRHIAFNSWRNGKPDIFIMDAEGNSPKLLINNVSHGVC